jgi:multicomponent Na+:H+ antiporter subunit D
MPLTSFGIVLCGLSLIGVPGTAGFVSKWYLHAGGAGKGPVVAGVPDRGLVTAGGGLCLALRRGAYFKPARRHAPIGTEAPLSMLLPAGLLVAAVTVYFGLDTLVHRGLGRRGCSVLLGGAR